MTTINISTATISYDRSKREYTLEIAGDVWAFPAGHKPQAIQAAISMLYPHWYALAQAMVQAYPYLESRVWTAVLILIDNKLTPTPAGDGLADVEGSNMALYTLTDNEGLITCPCPDHEQAPLIGDAMTIASSFQRCCKHVLAYILYCQNLILSGGDHATPINGGLS